MVIAAARSNGGKGGCPLGSLGGQLAETDPEARAQVQRDTRPLETAVDTILALAATG